MYSVDRRLALALAGSVALHAVVLDYLEMGRRGAAPAVASRPLQVTLAASQNRPSLVPKPAARPMAPPPATAAPIAVHGGVKQAPISISVPGERYLLASEVDIRAQPVHMATLVYPEIAQARRIAGLVQLRVFISETGKIDAVDVVQAAPPGVFEAAALKALLATEFTPAQKDGHNVKSQKLLELNFDPYENINQP